MKVLLVNGSPRANGNMAWVVKNLRREGAVPRPADEPWQPMNFIR